MHHHIQDAGRYAAKDVPHICDLLLKEAEAWRALVGLHGMCLSHAYAVVQEPQAGVSSDSVLQTQVREGGYIAALSGLAAHLDAMSAEALKLRQARKARRVLEVACVQEAIRSHTDEILTMGQALAHNNGVSIAGATASIRATTQRTNARIAQLRSLLEAMSTARQRVFPHDIQILVGVRRGDTDEVQTMEHFFDDLFKHDREVTDSTVERTLQRLFYSEKSSGCKGEQAQFARRVPVEDAAIAERAAGTQEE